MRSRIVAAYSQDRSVLERMTSRHLKEEREGNLASYEEATKLRKEDLDVVDQIITKAKPLEMVDLPEEDEGNMATCALFRQSDGQTEPPLMICEVHLRTSMISFHVSVMGEREDQRPLNRAPSRQMQSY